MFDAISTCAKEPLKATGYLTGNLKHGHGISETQAGLYSGNRCMCLFRDC